MRRRRGPARRPFRRAKPFTAPPELRRANELLDAGSHAQAAVAFEKIADRTAARHGPRAPIFYLRAGQAYLLAGEIKKGMLYVRQGLEMIAVRRDWLALERFGQRTVDELNEIGLQAEAQEITAYLKERIPQRVNTPVARSPRSLPTHCPGCGAPLRSNEVEWLDQNTAECVYCGSPVQGNE